MSLTEFDQEEYDRNRREEGIAIGIAEGEERERIANARNFKRLGVSDEIIAEATGLSREDIAAL